MVQNWQNFMSPTGGYSDNTFQFGLGSILTDIGLSVVGVSAVNNRLSAIDALKRKHTASSINKIQSKNIGPFLPGDAAARTHILNTIRTERRDLKLSKKINSLKSTKWALKGVGYSYLAMGTAQIFENMLTPNYSMTAAAKQSNADIGQGPLDSATAYTQRQRALMAIHDSQLGISSVIGNESQYFHR